MSNAREIYYKIIGKDYMSRTFKSINGAALKTETRLGSLSKKTSTLKSNLRGAAAEIPGLSSGLRFLGNPLTMAAGGVGLLAMGLSRAKDEAVAFNNEFRELINLNLDKTTSQTDNLKNQVLQTSYDAGFNPLQTSTGFYDVQSITGEYGAVVQNVVETAGSFAQVMRADFNKTVAGSAQAMEIYGFRVNKVDDYLSSLYKTVMVGKTTFDQLTQVQVEYANAAASVGQSFDQANKIFAAFSKVNKTVNIAATMTKTAFEDLTKKSTLQGLKQIGIHVFDAKGQMRGVDTILEDMIPKFKTMSDFEFASLKEKIGGSEGLRGLLDMARNSGDKLLQSLNAFDKAEFNSVDAYKKALQDVTFLNDQLSNKLSASWIGLGDSLLPVWSNLKLLSIGILDNTRNANDNIGDVWNSFFNMPKLITDKALGYNTVVNSRSGHAKTKYEAAIGDVNSKTPLSEVGDLRKQIVGDLKIANEKANTKGSETLRDAYKNQALALGSLLEQLEINKTLDPSGNPSTGTEGSGTDGKISKGLTDISGGGSQMRNVNIQIDSLIKELIIQTNTLSEATPEIEAKLTESLVRAIGGAEQITMN
ncbi:MAG: phage tail tape measure protein [Bacteroidota bacterium]